MIEPKILPKRERNRGIFEGILGFPDTAFVRTDVEHLCRFLDSVPREKARIVESENG